jgi:hypothetical protein
LAGDIRAKRGCEASEVCGATVSLGRASGWKRESELQFGHPSEPCLRGSAGADFRNDSTLALNQSIQPGNPAPPREQLRGFYADGLLDGHAPALVVLLAVQALSVARIDPLWGLLDLTPEGRGDFFPKVNYD